jgi:hypothetical protein
VDSVGTYVRLGVDATAFGRGLMASALAEVTAVCPHVLAQLEAAFERTVRAVSGAPPGASTVAIVTLVAGALRWAYVGASGFVVL